MSGWTEEEEEEEEEERHVCVCLMAAGGFEEVVDADRVLVVMEVPKEGLRHHRLALPLDADVRC